MVKVGGQDVDLQMGVNNLLMNDAQVFIDTAVNIQQHCQFLMFDVFYS